MNAGYDAKAAAYFDNVRRDIAPLLPPHAPRALEIGCGSGATLAWLRDSGRAGSTVGIELSPAAAAVARSRVDVLHVGDAEAIVAGGVLAPASFQLVLCLDVLEHLIDPWRLVAQLPALMAPGALLVASIPNARHLQLVLPLLLQGRFRYRDDGLLDRTHLRFFTREGALELLTVPGLAVEQCRRRLHPWPSRTGWVNALSAGLLRDLLATHYLVAARRT